MMKNGIASASASHGTSILAEISIGTTPRPVTISMASHTAICSSPAAPSPSSLPARISSGLADASSTSTTLFSFSVAVPCIR